jgi:hypothetical protein
VAEFLQAGDKRVSYRRIRDGEADPPDLVGLLCVRGARRGEEAASNGRDEGSAFHHSIT